MKRERVLITVKTYPTLSQSYAELVCTAVFREDGSWVRIYPVPFRLMDHSQQFAKWTWVDLPLVRRTKDKRPESFSPADRDDITLGETIGTSNGRRRKRLAGMQRNWLPWRPNCGSGIFSTNQSAMTTSVSPKNSLGFSITGSQTNRGANLGCGSWIGKSGCFTGIA